MTPDRTNAEEWAATSPSSTLLWVVEEAARWSDPDRLEAAKAELTRRDIRYTAALSEERRGG